MVLGALAFGCFSVLWTSLSFLLSAAPFHDSNTVIGLFGLAGVAGAGTATVVGRLADHGHGALATTLTTVLIALSFGLLYLFRHSTIGLIAAIIVLDLAVQGVHISNQHAIDQLSPDARSRLTTAYMVAFGAGGAVLRRSPRRSTPRRAGGGVCVIGGATGLASLLVWGGDARAGGLTALLAFALPEAFASALGAFAREDKCWPHWGPPCLERRRRSTRG